LLGFHLSKDSTLLPATSKNQCVFDIQSVKILNRSIVIEILLGILFIEKAQANISTILYNIIY